MFPRLPLLRANRFQPPDAVCVLSAQKKTILRLFRLSILRLWGVLLLMIAPVAMTPCEAAEVNWPERLRYRMFVLSDTSFSSDAELESAIQQLQRAAITGYNCAVLAKSAELIQPQVAGDEYLARLRSLRDEANALGIGLVPSVMPFDSDALTKQYDPHLAEGLPVRNVLYVCDGAEAHLRPDPQITLVNSGFETVGQNGIPGWQLVGLQPGRTATIDTSQAFYGDSSLKFENAAEKASNLAYRATQTVRLPPFQLFCISVWVRSEAPGGDTCFYLAVSEQNRFLGMSYVNPGEAGEWRRHGFLFNSLHGGDVELRLGVHDSTSTAHQIWFDHLEIEHVGLLNVLRRPGCPLLVRNERGRAYEERRDYVVVGKDNFIRETEDGSTVDFGSQFLRLTKRTRIRNGERLRISFYSPSYFQYPPVSICMHAHQLDDFFAAEITTLRNELLPVGYHLATKYMSTANWDEACRRTKKTPGAQWGNSLQSQLNTISKNGDRTLCFVWSDMYEPWNDPYSQYWVCNGTFEDAWKYLPKDLIVLNSHYSADESKSPRFFAANVHRQVIAGDAKVGKWMEANADIPGIVGVMNTDTALDEFAAGAWGWLSHDVREQLPPAPDSQHQTESGASMSVQAPPEFRTWRDASGQYEVEAAFAKLEASIVTLRKRDGQQITIPYRSLSKEDLRWLRRGVTKRQQP